MPLTPDEQRIVIRSNVESIPFWNSLIKNVSNCVIMV